MLFKVILNDGSYRIAMMLCITSNDQLVLDDEIYIPCDKVVGIELTKSESASNVFRSR